jgi:hypothetical protein
MPKRSHDLTALVERFVGDLEALLEKALGPRVEAALNEISHAVLGGGRPALPVAKTAARGRPAGVGRPAKRGRPAGKAAGKGRARKAAGADEAMCRFPGCPNKHSGPRYHKFCRDHFAKLSADEREKYKKLWKEAHGG